MKNLILILLFIPLLIVSSCSTSLNSKLLEMNSEELLEYSKSHYQLYDNKSGLEMVEMERLQKTAIILDGLLLPDNIKWEDLQFEDPDFKDKLKPRSSELSNSDDFTRVQFSYKKIKEVNKEGKKNV